MKTAVIIAAYDCEKYIIDCYKSVKQQIAPCEIDIRIGVDGCAKTADVLRRARVPYYWSGKNVGAYVMRNSLIAAAPADIYAYFDADDIMLQGYIRKSIMVIDSGADVVMTSKNSVSADLRKQTPGRVERGGAIAFTAKALETVGGFQPYRCAGDTDFMCRLESAGYKIHEINEALYLRRLHPASLTRQSGTGMGSPYRKKVWNAMCEARKQGVIKIDPVVVGLNKR